MQYTFKVSNKTLMPLVKIIINSFKTIGFVNQNTDSTGGSIVSEYRLRK